MSWAVLNVSNNCRHCAVSIDQRLSSDSFLVFDVESVLKTVFVFPNFVLFSYFCIIYELNKWILYHIFYEEG